jgi:hypothetical protein
VLINSIMALRAAVGSQRTDEDVPEESAGAHVFHGNKMGILSLLGKG